MLRTGQDYLDSLQDSRVIYVGDEKVTDVVAHRGFGEAARTIAAIYDLKCDPSNRADMTAEDTDGTLYSAYLLAPRSREDLEKRRRCHQRIAETTHGLLGRSPDHVGSLITGLAMESLAVDTTDDRSLSRNLLAYYRSVRERDAFVVYAVLPSRPAMVSATPRESCSGLRVVREADDGLTLRGVKALASAAMLADEVWVGNLQPLSPGQDMESITCVVRCNAPGLQIWSRKAFAAHATSESDSPLTWRYDEGDAVLMFDNVKVDWDRVFVHGDPVLSSEIYVRTPAHCLANHQSAVRSLAKVQLLVGLGNHLALTSGADAVPAVRETLGRLAAFEATLAALVDAQVAACESWPGGGVSPNRRYVYAALNWCQESMPVLVDVLRELFGAGVLRFPATADFAHAPALVPTFERCWGSADAALEQMQLFKLAWDLIGSEFAGRHQQYERFYAGPSFVVRRHSYREAPWDVFDAIVTRLIARCHLESARRTP